MPRFRERFALSCVGCALLLAVGLVAWALAAGSSEAEQGAIHNCPQAGKWAISVWDGPDGTETGEALAACGADAVEVAYALDPQTGGWLGWFRGRPEISKLLTLDGNQGVLALGRIGAPPPTPTAMPTATRTPTPTPSPTPTPTPTPGGPELGTYSGTTSQGEPIEFDVVEGSAGSRVISRIDHGYTGTLGGGGTCSGDWEVTGSLPIVNNTFSYQTSVLDISGTFDSATSASGDLEVNIPGGQYGCKSGPVTWTASLR